MVRTVEIPGDQIEVHADIGPGRVVRAMLIVDDGEAEAAKSVDPTGRDIDQWEAELDALLEMSPPNPFPVDDSREAIYGPDPEELSRLE